MSIEILFYFIDLSYMSLILNSTRFIIQDNLFILALKNERYFSIGVLGLAQSLIVKINKFK